MEAGALQKILNAKADAEFNHTVYAAFDALIAELNKVSAYPYEVQVKVCSLRDFLMINEPVKEANRLKTTGAFVAKVDALQQQIDELSGELDATRGG